jgi:uncharacterized protein
MTIANKTKKLSAKKIAESFFERLEDSGIVASSKQLKEITEKISETINYHPTIGVFGKTGAGKSSLCNALFGQDVAKVSNIEACTRKPQAIIVQLTEQGRGITLLDVPGIGETREKDEKYKKLYESLLPKLDLILWVLKGDDRAFGADLDFYNDVLLSEVKKSKTPIIFVVNQADKIQPSKEWNIESHLPSKKQLVNIAAKVAYVREVFGTPSTRICAVSAEEGYRLVELVEKIVRCLPEGKKYGFARETKEENVSKATKKLAEEGVWKTVKNYASKVFNAAIPIITKAIVDIASKKLWSFFK